MNMIKKKTIAGIQLRSFPVKENMQEKFEETKEVIRSRRSKKNRQHDG